jgi:cytochrome c oxidase subunit 3
MAAIAAALGVLFVALQGSEWVQLVRLGLTLTSSTYGSFFYVIVGAHALHALGGILALVWLAWRQAHRPVRPETMSAVQIFWYFVVGVWPAPARSAGARTTARSAPSCSPAPP